MDTAVVFSRASIGIDSPLVSVEVHISRGLPNMSIVGLPETAVRESRDRVRSAILNNQYEFPLGRITISLAPADLPKEGSRFDLAIALGILAASGQVRDTGLAGHEFIGELSLHGTLRPVRGILPCARAVQRSGRALVLPAENAAEAALIHELELLPATQLAEICAHLNGIVRIERRSAAAPAPAAHAVPDLADIRSQHHARRALEIAAAGAHNLLLIGPPGTGKTMLAERLPGILPAITEEQALESAAVASLGRNGFDPASWRRRPFRAPHHTASAVAMVGGGSQPRPGEISLAHHGVLFLDELPEFDRHVLEVLREPLESGRIVISRAAMQAQFPAEFQLVAAMNPCPCGYLGDASGRCRCTEERIARYRSRISGPLLDRIDMHVEVPNVTAEILRTRAGTPPETSATVAERVAAAHGRQIERAGKANARLGNREVEQSCKLSSAQADLLQLAVERLGLSARALHRVLKVTRTIADLAECDSIRDEHLTEAISFRRMDRRSVN